MQYSEWLNDKIVKKQKTIYDFKPVSSSAMGEYRNGRRMPKWSYHIIICEALSLEACRDEWEQFRKDFVRNDKL